MRIGGQILWNVTPICETSQICCLMVKFHTRDVLGGHLKDPLFLLVHLLSVTLQLRKISPESINLERKFYLDCSSDTLCTRGEFGRVTYWSQTFRTHRKSTQKRLNAKEVIFPKKKRRIYFSDSRWTNQNRRRSGTENIHLDTAATKSRRGSQ